MLISSEKQLLINLNKIQIFYIDKFIKDLFIKYHEIQYCILCNGSDNEFIAEKDQYGIPCPTVRCRDCGLIFSKKQLTNESMIRFYDKYYRRIYEGVDGVVSLIEIMEPPMIEFMGPFFHRFLPPAGT